MGKVLEHNHPPRGFHRHSLQQTVFRNKPISQMRNRGLRTADPLGKSWRVSDSKARKLWNEIYQTFLSAGRATWEQRLSNLQFLRDFSGEAGGFFPPTYPPSSFQCGNLSTGVRNPEILKAFGWNPARSHWSSFREVVHGGPHQIVLTSRWVSLSPHRSP